jgi:hypothetical protein
VRSGAAQRVDRHGRRCRSGGCCGRWDGGDGRCCDRRNLRHRALTVHRICWVRQLPCVRLSAAAGRAQDEDEERDLTDFVATSMGLTFQDASPILANQALAVMGLKQ